MRASRIRLAVQLAAFAALIWLGAAGVRRIVLWGREPSLPTLSCEYGRHIARCLMYDLQRILTADAAGGYRRLLEPLAFFVGLGLLLGKGWCGWICPLGTIQDLLTRLRAALGVRAARPGPRLERGLLAGGNGILAAALIVSVLIGWPDSKLALWRDDLFRPFCQICPSRRIAPLLVGRPGEFLHVDRTTDLSEILSILSLATLGAFSLGAFASRRFWCRLCPLGALLRIVRLNTWCAAGLAKDGLRCTGCGACRAACPMGIEKVYREEGSGDRLAGVLDRRCTLCLRCVEACPEDGVLEARWAGVCVFRSRFAYGPRAAAAPRMDPPRQPGSPPGVASRPSGRPSSSRGGGWPGRADSR